MNFCAPFERSLPFIALLSLPGTSVGRLPLWRLLPEPLRQLGRVGVVMKHWFGNSEQVELVGMWSVTRSVCSRYVVGNAVGMWSVSHSVCGRYMVEWHFDDDQTTCFSGAGRLLLIFPWRSLAWNVTMFSLVLETNRDYNPGQNEWKVSRQPPLPIQCWLFGSRSPVARTRTNIE